MSSTTSNIKEPREAVVTVRNSNINKFGTLQERHTPLKVYADRRGPRNSETSRGTYTKAHQGAHEETQRRQKDETSTTIAQRWSFIISLQFCTHNARAHTKIVELPPLRNQLDASQPDSQNGLVIPAPTAFPYALQQVSPKASTAQHHRINIPPRGLAATHLITDCETPRRAQSSRRSRRAGDVENYQPTKCLDDRDGANRYSTNPGRRQHIPSNPKCISPHSAKLSISRHRHSRTTLSPWLYLRPRIKRNMTESNNSDWILFVQFLFCSSSNFIILFISHFLSQVTFQSYRLLFPASWLDMSDHSITFDYKYSSYNFHSSKSNLVASLSSCSHAASSVELSCVFAPIRKPIRKVIRSRIAKAYIKYVEYDKAKALIIYTYEETY